MAKKANERITEKLFEDYLKSQGITEENNWKIEYQKSVNPKLSFTSKTGKGGEGNPDFIITKKGCSNFVIIVQIKEKVDKLVKSGRKAGEVSQSQSNIGPYAVNGALFYANQVHTNFNTIFIGAVGATKEEFTHEMYYYDQHKENYIELLNNNLSDFNSLKEIIGELREKYEEIPTKVKNKNLHTAKKEKNDEFYTQLSDIENELKHYKEQFKGKVVYCNCDDHKWSNFFQYFSMNFEHLGLKKLIATHFDSDEVSYKLEITKDENGDGKIDHLDTIETKLKQNGDFRSEECIEILKESDIIVTNPPFSLFREYIAQMMEYDKKFLVIGNQNAITYKEVFGMIRDNRLWLGVNNNQSFVFRTPYENNLEDNVKFCKQKGFDGPNYVKVPAINWFTNLSHNKRTEKLILFKEYTKEEYPKYDNYDAIEVSKVKEIPIDYDGVMGVPITFLDKWCPEQFEILDLNPHFFTIVENGGIKPKQLTIKGQKDPYARILIKKKINEKI